MENPETVPTVPADPVPDPADVDCSCFYCTGEEDLVEQDDDQYEDVEDDYDEGYDDGYDNGYDVGYKAGSAAPIAPVTTFGVTLIRWSALVLIIGLINAPWIIGALRAL